MLPSSVMLGENSPLLRDASASDAEATSIVAEAEAMAALRVGESQRPQEVRMQLSGTEPPSPSPSNYGSTPNPNPDPDPDPSNSGGNNDNNNNNSNDADERLDPSVDFLTRTRQRLRCLFFFFTCPIIPLAALLTMLLFCVLYNAFLYPASSHCTSPLRLYAILSAVIFLYTPHHRRFKRFLSRNDASHPDDRMYDHLYLTFCLAYIYVGVAWTENCRTSFSQEGCGCPNLYHSTRIYVYTLCMLATVLALPMLCLPCVYLWIVRGAAADALEAAATIAAEDVRGGGSPTITVEEILESMEKVQEEAPSQDAEMEVEVKECCICMTELDCTIDTDTNDDSSDVEQPSPNTKEIVLRTNCGHMFHRTCLGTWLGGNWRNDDENNRTIATRRCCPLCRKDLTPNRDANDTERPSR